MGRVGLNRCGPPNGCGSILGNGAQGMGPISDFRRRRHKTPHKGDKRRTIDSFQNRCSKSENYHADAIFVVGLPHDHRTAAADFDLHPSQLARVVTV
jgi:hypothetical protein